MDVVLLTGGFQGWECPNCGLSERTPPLPPNATRYHPCPRLHGLSAPLVRAGDDAKVEAAEREDYLGDAVQASGDDGIPYMNIRVTFPDHEDLYVQPELATARVVS